MATEHDGLRTPPTARRSGVVLGVLAAVVLAHPLYLWPQLGRAPDARLLAGFVRPVLTLVGAFLLTYAGLVAFRDTWRPVTPGTAALFPATTSIAVLALQWYDETVHGLVAMQPLDNNPVLVGALALGFMIGGSLLRRERRAAVGAFSLGCVGLFLLGVVGDQTRPPVALVGGVALGLAALVIGALGYGLTAPVAGDASR